MKKLLFLACSLLAFNAWAEDAETVTIEVTTSNGAVNSPGNWSLYWTSNVADKPVVKVSNAKANIGTFSSEGVYDFRAGTALTATYTITTEADDYYVSAFSFTAYGSGPVINVGNGDVAIQSDGTEFSQTLEYGDVASFVVKTSNSTTKLKEFFITLTKISAAGIEEAITNRKAEVLADMTLWKPILGERLFNTYNVQLEGATTIDAVNAVEESFLNDANGRVITLKNARRATNSRPAYLTFEDTYGHMTTQPVETSYWMIKRIAGTKSFKLYNLEGNTYVGFSLLQGQQDGNQLEFAAEGDAATLQLFKNEDGTYPGTGIKVMNYDDDWGFNVNGNDDDRKLVVYALPDGGGSWEIALAGTPADELVTDGSKYYRIRSTRATNQFLDKGSLMGIPTVVENEKAEGASQEISQRRDGLGAIWSLHATEDGKVILRNAAADFEGKEACYGMTYGSIYNTSVEPTEFEILAAYNTSNYPHDYPQACAIRCVIVNGTGATETRYADVQNNGIGRLASWDRVDNTRNYNGGTYLFHEVTDYEEVKAAYIAATNDNSYKEAAATSADTQIDLYKNFPELWNTAEATACVEEYREGEATTVAEANVNLANKVTRIIKQTADGKTVRIANVDRGDKHYITHGAAHNATGGAISANDTDSGNNVLLCTVGEDNELKTLWTLFVNDEGNYKLVNVLSGEAVKHHAGGETAQDMTSEAEGSYFVIEPNTSEKADLDYAIQIHYPGANCWHEHSEAQGRRVVLWSNADGSAASGWYVNVMEEVEAEGVETVKAELLYDSNADTHYIVFSHTDSSFDVHPQADNCLINPLKVKLISTAAPAAKPGMRRETSVNTVTAYEVSALQEKNEDNEIVLPVGKLAVGDYTISVPAGMFTVGNSVVGALNSAYSVDATGKTTGNEEITFEVTVTDNAIYDLQGRRLSAPVKGINIIGGRKVLVK